jgi:hypothetical protein
MHSLKQQLDDGARTTKAISGSWKWTVRIYFLVKIQLRVIMYHPRLCSYGKRVVDTFLQRIGLYRTWQLWHLTGSLHIPMKYRFRYKLRKSGVSHPYTQTFSVQKMTLRVCWQIQIQNI